MGIVDIVDIAAIPKDSWLPRLKDSDVIVVGGDGLRILCDG